MYKVLIIDDEPWARKVVMNLCDWAKMDLEVIGEASDGNQGLQMIQDLNPDIVITDMRMPGLDGTDLLKAIYDHSSKIKVIAMSGYSDFAYLKQAIRTRVVEYLLKPLEQKELHEALTMAMHLLDQKYSEDLSDVDLFSNKENLQAYLDQLKIMEEALVGYNVDRLSLSMKAIANLVEKEDSLQLIEKVLKRLKSKIHFFIAENDYSIEDLFEQQPHVESFEAMTDFVIEVLSLLKEKQHQENVLNLTDVKNYMNQYYNHNISLDTIAESFLVTKEHLSRIFKKSEGLTIGDYIKKIRMDKSRELMVDHHMPIKEVATCVGYSDLAYFYRVFKKFYGMAPKEYIKYVNNVQ